MLKIYLLIFFLFCPFFVQAQAGEPGGAYSKDQYNAYYQDKKIEEAEASTFSILDEEYAKDRLHVYYKGQAIDSAAPDSIQVIAPGYARDAGQAYRGKEIISGVDPATFQIINHEYYKDKDDVYFRGEIVENAHPGTFRMMANDYARDVDYFYRLGKAVAKSSNQFYERFINFDLSGTCQPDVPASTTESELTALAHGYAKDGACIYFQAEALVNSHPATFVIISERLAKDKNFVYYKSADGVKTVPFASATTFQALGGNYYKDKYAVYYGEEPEIINGAVVDAFKFSCSGDKCTYEAEDGRRFYSGGLEVGLDDATRQIIGEAKLINSSAEDIAALISYNKAKRDPGKEKETNDKFLKDMVVGVYDLDAKAKTAIVNFIFYGTETTRILGAGERAGVVNSYKTAFGRLPQTEQDWADILKIANGRWPTERNEIAEERADRRFRYIFHRAPYSFDQHDQAAITIISYGLRNRIRKTDSEKAAILTFRKMFSDYPSSASDWDMVRAIAYSGATR